MAYVRLPQCPPLPPEIWIRALTYNNDLTHLWTACRHVSRDFRAYTEQVFAESVIRDTFIDFQLEKINLGGKGKRPEVPTSFHTFGPGIKLENGDRDKAIVCFRDKRLRGDIAHGKKKDYDRIMDRWKENVRELKPQMPHYTIRVGSLVNDTDLPGLEINVVDREITFDWRGMYTSFFREQLLLRNLKLAWQRKVDAKLKSNKEGVSKGEKLSTTDYPSTWGVAEDEIRKKIRRKRLIEHYPDDERMKWAIGSLKHLENQGETGGSGKVFTMNAELPGAGLGERWYGCDNLVQELWLDEWSCMHRINIKAEHVRGKEIFPQYSTPPPDLKSEESQSRS